MEEDVQNADAPFEMNEKNLYREESFTDIKVGTIKRLTPIQLDGTPDNSRNPIFLGMTQLMSPKGPLPIQNMIPARNLGEAIEKFPEAMNAAVEKLVKAAEKARQEESSKIVVPGSNNW
jgi:hypothetical protein